MVPNECKRARLLVLAALGITPLALCLFVPAGADPRPVPVAADAAPAAQSAAVPQAGAGERSAAAAPAALGFFGAPVGMVMEHDWSADTTVELQATDGDVARMRVELAGRMTITVLDRQASELIAEVVFPVVDGRLTTAGNQLPVARDSALALDLGRPALVRMRRDGEPLGYRFADGVAVDHRNLVRGIWTALRFQPRETAAWTAQENDVLGTADVEYRWQHATAGDGGARSGKLRKVRVGYAAPAHGADPVVGTGEGELHWNRDLGWFEQGWWQEQSHRTLSEARIAIGSTLRVQTQLVDIDWRDVHDGASLWAGAWLPAASEAATDLAGREAERQLRRLADVTLAQLIADLSALAQQGQLDGEPGHGKHRDLMWLLRTRPGALAELERLLPGLDPALAGAALAAIGATQMPAAQTMLAQLFADASQPLATRLSAAASVFQLERPSAELVGCFAATLQAGTAFDEATAAGMLALGTLAARSGEAARAGAIGNLLALEPRAAQRGAIGMWLEALGNAGVDAALAAAERYRSAEDARLRLAAVSAVRSVRGDAAWQFAATALQDQTPAVRGRAVEVLASRREAGAFAALASALRGDGDARVRATAIDALAGRAGEPAVRELLHAAAASDADAEVRQLAMRVLAGH